MRAPSIGYIAERYGEYKQVERISVGHSYAVVVKDARGVTEGYHTLNPSVSAQVIGALRLDDVKDGWTVVNLSPL